MRPTRPGAPGALITTVSDGPKPRPDRRTCPPWRAGIGSRLSASRPSGTGVDGSDAPPEPASAPEVESAATVSAGSGSAPPRHDGTTARAIAASAISPTTACLAFDRLMGAPVLASSVAARAGRGPGWPAGAAESLLAGPVPAVGCQAKDR